MKLQPTTFYFLLMLGAAGCADALASKPLAGPEKTQVPANAASQNQSVDCSAAYGGQPASCERVACNKLYESFIGAWEGEFAAYVREKSSNDKPVFRPYDDAISYTEADCLKNTATADNFIIGHRTDTYPVFDDLSARVDKGLLITGRNANGIPYLRTIDEHGASDYALVYQDTAAKLSVWNLHLPASGSKPEMTYTTIDGQDFSVTAAQKRNATITLKVDPAAAPYWQGVIAYGTHSRK